ncbi:MAG: 50S ribosomal protein L4 [Nanobdellota archaeon]
MEVSIVKRKNESGGNVKLPSQFEEEIRPDLIKKSSFAVKSNSRQSYGNSPDAGFRHASALSRRRRKYRGAYGYGISRVPRKILSKNGTRFNWVGATAPNTRGGFRAHGPDSEKNFSVKINDKERKKSIRSALAATMNKNYVTSKGHKIPSNYPFVLSSVFDDIKKTSELAKELNLIGFSDELERISDKKVRAGKGKTRGRKYRKKVGPLIVISSGSSLEKSAGNIPGIDVVEVSQLNTDLLSPGSKPGRVTLFTEKALKEMEEKKLYI